MGIFGTLFDFLKRMVENMLLFSLVHVVYFFGGILAAYIVPPMLAPRILFAGAYMAPGLTGWFLLNPFYHVCALGFAILCAILGPWLYHRYTMRGRGELAAIREASAMQSAADWQRVAVNTSFEGWREGVDQQQGAGRPEDRAHGVARDKSSQ